MRERPSQGQGGLSGRAGGRLFHGRLHVPPKTALDRSPPCSPLVSLLPRVRLPQAEWLLHEQGWNWLECLGLLADVDVDAAEGLALQDWGALKARIAARIDAFEHLQPQVCRRAGRCDHGARRQRNLVFHVSHRSVVCVLCRN